MGSHNKFLYVKSQNYVTKGFMPFVFCFRRKHYVRWRHCVFSWFI